MKRRTLLRGMVTLPWLGAVGGCRESEVKAKGTLRVILHGPFGVVTTRRENQYRIIAFVPSDPKKAHEFRFRTPAHLASAESQGKRYRFELSENGLELSNRLPYRDHGFDDFNLGNIGDWQPQPEKYFIFLDLPAPDVITFIPPAQSVLFKDGRTGTMPLDQILEYRLRNANEVRIQSKELGNQPPMSSSELMQEFRNHWASQEHREQKPTQRPDIDNDLKQHSHPDISTFFFGVGLPEKNYSDLQMESLGNEFFNDVLLKSFPRTPRRDRLEIVRTLGYGQPCQPAYERKSALTALPAAYQRWLPQPHLQTVGASEDCKYGGLSGCTDAAGC